MWEMGADEIHLWGFGLDDSTVDGPLSPPERQRAARLIFPLHRARFAAARGRLRRILGGYLGRDPATLVFAYAPRGKPFLPGANLHFNLSHSENRGLLAVSARWELGVDLEAVRDLTPGLAERYFAPAEREALSRLPSEQRREAFFHCWTRKEAYLKARGEGLRIALDSFEVTLSPGEPAALWLVAGDRVEAAQWRLAALDPAPGFVGALAVRAHGWRLVWRSR